MKPKWNSEVFKWKAQNAKNKMTFGKKYNRFHRAVILQNTHTIRLRSHCRQMWPKCFTFFFAHMTKILFFSWIAQTTWNLIFSIPICATLAIRSHCKSSVTFSLLFSTQWIEVTTLKLFAIFTPGIRWSYSFEKKLGRFCCENLATLFVLFFYTCGSVQNHDLFTLEIWYWPHLKQKCEQLYKKIRSEKTNLNLALNVHSVQKFVNYLHFKNKQTNKNTWIGFKHEIKLYNLHTCMT